MPEKTSKTTEILSALLITSEEQLEENRLYDDTIIQSPILSTLEETSQKLSFLPTCLIKHLISPNSNNITQQLQEFRNLLRDLTTSQLDTPCKIYSVSSNNELKEHDDNEGTTALMVAAYLGKPYHVKLLLEKGASTNIQQKNMELTALHFAILSPSSDKKTLATIVKLLIQYGAKPEIKESRNLNALQLCIIQNQLEIVFALEETLPQNVLTSMSLQTKNNKTIVELAIEKNIEIEKNQKRSPGNQTYLSDLFIATLQRLMFQASQSIENFYFPKDISSSSLARLDDVDENKARFKITPVINALLQKEDKIAEHKQNSRGANISASNANLLSHLTNSVVTELPAQLVQNDVNNNENAIQLRNENTRPLMIACYLGNKDAVELLLQANANPNAKQSVSQRNALHCLAMSPTHYVKKERWAAISKLLVDKGVDPFEADKDGNTFLHLCYKFGHNELVSAFLSPFNTETKKALKNVLNNAHLRPKQLKTTTSKNKSDVTESETAAVKRIKRADFFKTADKLEAVTSRQTALLNITNNQPVVSNPPAVVVTIHIDLTEEEHQVDPTQDPSYTTTTFRK